MVCWHTADELRQLDAGSWFASEHAGQRIPLLSEVLELLAYAHLHLVRTLCERGQTCRALKRCLATCTHVLA